jgi:hypothetical protein
MRGLMRGALIINCTNSRVPINEQALHFAFHPRLRKSRGFYLPERAFQHGTGGARKQKRGDPKPATPIFVEDVVTNELKFTGAK